MLTQACDAIETGLLSLPDPSQLEDVRKQHQTNTHTQLGRSGV
jgi:hypothetical protein